MYIYIAATLRTCCKQETTQREVGLIYCKQETRNNTDKFGLKLAITK